MTTAITIAVLTLFRPGYLVVAPAPHTSLVIRAGEKRIELLPGRKAGLRMAGREVDVFANRQTTPTRGVEIGGRGGAGDFILSIPGKIERRYHGTLRVTADGAMLMPVLTVPLEWAVWSAVAAELPADAPVEAKKAMAVVARSFYAAAERRHRGYDYCDTTHCQFFTAKGEPVEDAPPVRLTYHGEYFAPVYSASCGGRTRTAAENGWEMSPYPYFAVECPPCVRNSAAYERRLPADLAAVLLEGASESSRLAINRLLGWATLPSNNFVAKREGELIHVTGRGKGHGAGLCQEGAMELAREGRGFADILRVYFPGVELR